jgi:hypothetical protein
MPKKNLSQLKEVIGNATQQFQNMPLGKKDYLNKVILFVSFDLTGSTLYKPNNPETWGKTFEVFFTEITDAMVNNAADEIAPDVVFEVWKFQGDEILFFAEVPSQDILVQGIEKTYSVLLEKSSAVLEESRLNNPAYPLNVKATAWIALIDAVTNRTFFPNDFVQNQGKATYHYPPDFIGTSIDEGFRVAKAFGDSRRLALAFELACCLVDTAALSKIYVVGAQKLKGIWNDHDYPALWYCEETDKPSLNSDIWTELRDHRTAILNHSNSNNNLNKVFLSASNNKDYLLQVFNNMKFSTDAKLNKIKKALGL